MNVEIRERLLRYLVRHGRRLENVRPACPVYLRILRPDDARADDFAQLKGIFQNLVGMALKAASLTSNVSPAGIRPRVRICRWRSPVRRAFAFRDVCAGRSYAYAPLIVQEVVSRRLYFGRRGRFNQASS